jgi:chromatin segregation and condensation protein Rec8/ScpA/Scc1 (kleisin family)
MMNEIVRKGKKKSLHALFKDMRSRSEMVCTFLAILELIRMRQIRAVQEVGEFTDILIQKSEEAEQTDMEELPMADVLDTGSGRTL